MAGMTQVAVATSSSMESNKPINEQKSNVAIMTTAIGGGLIMGAGMELGTNMAYKAIEKNEDWLAKNYIFAKQANRAESVRNWKETFRTASIGTNEELAQNTFRSIDNWTSKANFMNDNKSIFRSGEGLWGKGEALGTNINKTLRTGLAANTFVAGLSTKQGRIFNYGIGSLMSVAAGGLAIKNQNDRIENQSGR